MSEDIQKLREENRRMREEIQQAGLNNQDMATIYKLSQNDR